ncbi:Activity-regulated cytoskeleton-associated protein [Folsomia candida]|uniref:Activity-regulated cytoskeleton-associated protein n=1 Tax=Folsomia candida TaxID=158441 RepID=A0A226EAT3_FOLCA|nr:Activity-regulated cytoskeleton-associated protein [Folsomia candida]OXA54318.1 Activity-regulated cytoskeleton-associated protein [Folsomia candida]
MPSDDEDNKAYGFTPLAQLKANLGGEKVPFDVGKTVRIQTQPLSSSPTITTPDISSVATSLTRIEKTLKAVTDSHTSLARDVTALAVRVNAIDTSQASTHTTTSTTPTATGTVSGSGSGTTSGRGPPTVSYLNDSSPKPKYNPSLMSPEFFLQELEEYFALRNIPQSNWLLLMGRIFPQDSELASWWIASKPTIKTWAECRAAFIYYQTSDMNADLLNKQLYSRTQRFHEAFETYAWEIRALFHKVNPKVTDDVVVDRILNSCLPEIGTGLSANNYKTVVDLVKGARNVILTINKMRSFERKPPLRIRQSDPIPDKKSSYSVTGRAPHYTAHSETSSKSDSASVTTSASGDSGSTSSSTAPANPGQRAPARSAATCGYCKKPGHTIAECRARLRADERRATATASTSSASPGNC